MKNDKNHIFFMNLALEEARKAFQKAEVPVGALIVKEDQILSRAHNLKEQNNNLLGHAELLAIKKASEKLNSWRLESCKLYVSLEPCLMCIGAIVQARISQLIYACPDPKEGFSSYYALDKTKSWKHKIKISSGFYCHESSLLLKNFFKELRK